MKLDPRFIKLIYKISDTDPTITENQSSKDIPEGALWVNKRTGRVFISLFHPIIKKLFWIPISENIINLQEIEETSVLTKFSSPTINIVNPLNDDTCIAFYPLDENLHDYSNNYHLTYDNGNKVNYVPSIFNKGVKLDGSGAIRYRSNSNVNIDFSNGFSVSLWLKPDIIHSSGTIYQFADSNNRQINLWWDNQHKLFMRLVSTTNNPIDISFTPIINPMEVFSIYKFTHIVTVITPENVTLYINGSPVGYINREINLSNWTFSNFAFGGNHQTVGYCCACCDQMFYGIFDQIRIFNKALTPEEILILYNENYLILKGLQLLKDKFRTYKEEILIPGANIYQKTNGQQIDIKRKLTIIEKQGNINIEKSDSKALGDYAIFDKNSYIKFKLNSELSLPVTISFVARIKKDIFSLNLSKYDILSLIFSTRGIDSHDMDINPNDSILNATFAVAYKWCTYSGNTDMDLHAKSGNVHVFYDNMRENDLILLSDNGTNNSCTYEAIIFTGNYSINVNFYTVRYSGIIPNKGYFYVFHRGRLIKKFSASSFSPNDNLTINYDANTDTLQITKSSSLTELYTYQNDIITCGFDSSQDKMYINTGNEVKEIRTHRFIGDILNFIHNYSIINIILTIYKDKIKVSIYDFYSKQKIIEEEVPYNLFSNIQNVSDIKLSRVKFGIFNIDVNLFRRIFELITPEKFKIGFTQFRIFKGELSEDEIKMLINEDKFYPVRTQYTPKVFVNKPSLNEDLVLFYNFDKVDSNGNKVIDLSGNGHDGTWNGTPQYDKGIFGCAAKFNEDSYILVNPKPNLGNQFTISFWIKSNNTNNSNDSVIQLVNTNGSSGSENLFEFWFKNTQGNTVLTINGTDYILHSVNEILNQWVHYALVVSDKTYIYRNGKLIKIINEIPNMSRYTRFQIGADWDSSNPNTDNYKGLLDQLRVYKRALTEDEIQTLYREMLWTIK